MFYFLSSSIFLFSFYYVYVCVYFSYFFRKVYVVCLFLYNSSLGTKSVHRFIHRYLKNSDRSTDRDIRHTNTHWYKDTDTQARLLYMQKYLENKSSVIAHKAIKLSVAINGRNLLDSRKNCPEEKSRNSLKISLKILRSCFLESQIIFTDTLKHYNYDGLYPNKRS